MVHGFIFALLTYMKLTLKQLEIILADNETQLKTSLLTNDIERILELMNHRTIVKDCIIELLKHKLQLTTKQRRV